MRNVREYRINGEFWPMPDATEWGDIPAGEQLSTAIPIYSTYRTHTWRYPYLPNCDFATMLEAIRGAQLTSLVTDPPDDAELPEEYTDVVVQSVERTHSGGHPRGIAITFLVYVG
jgi:hypothetical protein